MKQFLSFMLLGYLVVSAAPATAQEATIDDVSKEASRLAAELGKYRDTAPEAGAALFALPELSHAVTARHQLDTFDPSNRSREGVSRSERRPGPSHVYGRRPPKLEVGAARTQRFARAAVAVFYSGGRPCGSVRFHS